MVNPIVYAYLKSNYGRYDLESLKEKVISRGYAPQVYEEALEKIRAEQPSQGPSSQGNPNIVSNLLKEEVPSQGTNGHMIFAGSIATFILLFFSLNSFASSFYPAFYQGLLSGPLSLVVLLVVLLCAVLSLLGFYTVGRLSKVGLLKGTALAYLILLVIGTIITIGALIFTMFWAQSFMGNVGFTGNAVLGSSASDSISPLDFFPSNLYSSISPSIKIIFSSLFVLVFFFIVLSFLFSIGILKTKDKVRLALPTGVLLLVQSIFSLLGFFFVTYVLIQIILNPENILILLFDLAPYAKYSPMISYLSGAFSSIVILFESIYLYFVHLALE